MDNGVKKYASEQYVDNIISTSAQIKQVPILREQLGTTACRYYVNIEDLEPYVKYSSVKKEGYSQTYICLVFVCDDGTEHSVVMFNTMDIFYISKPTYWTDKMTVVCTNTSYTVDYSDRSTSSAIVKTIIPNTHYLMTGDNSEYIPTSDYSPATKKYVDDTVAAVQSDVSSLQEIVQSTALILSSPNGTRFQITIGNDGVLTATEITEVN